MTEQDLRLLDAAVAIARGAGALLREGAGSVHAAESKSSSTDLVTAYDRAAEDLIVSGLRERFPSHRILAEEGGDRGGAAGEPRWIVDPLDGTTNFAHGLPLFVVSIACEIEGAVRIGVIYAPVLDMLFTAVRGAGARLNDRPIRVSAADTLRTSLLSTGFPYDRHTSPDNNFAQFVTLKRRAQGIRRLGSAALDLAMVASGRLDGYWEFKLKPWDIAAGLLLVQEAGGTVSDWRGGPADLARGEVVASNGRIHGELLAGIETARGLAI